MVRDKEGKTCLHAAAEQGAIQACKIILEMSGSKIINEKDNKKQTPLHLATLNGHAKAIKILMDNGADPYIKDLAGASPVDFVTKRNLFFCNSIIEICLRNYERKSRVQGASSSNSIASSFGSESNLTPAPPTTPKNPYSRSFQPGHGRPPRPVIMSNNSTSNVSESFPKPSDLSKTAPGSLNGLNNQPEDLRNTIAIPPSPPTIAKTRPNLRGGWNSSERILSGSMRMSRASTRTSFASDYLENYGTNITENFGGSLNNIENLNGPLQNGLISGNNGNDPHAVINTAYTKPLAPNRITSSNSINNLRLYSGRSQDTPMSTASFDAPPSTQIPPPIKVIIIFLKDLIKIF